MESSGKVGGARKTVILHPRRKAAKESDAYRSPKFIFNICSNDDEAKNGWDTLAKQRGLKKFASTIIADYVLLYGRTADNILAYFRTVMDVLKHHRATLKLKKCKLFQDRCNFVGMNV